MSGKKDAADIIKLHGNIEWPPRVGLADLIVDLFPASYLKGNIGGFWNLWEATLV